MFISDGLEGFLAAFSDARADKVLEKLILDRVRAERRLVKYILAAAIRSRTAIPSLEVCAPTENLTAIQTDRSAGIVLRADYMECFVFSRSTASSGHLAGQVGQ